jgi:nicotinate-nucleotide--dimethylbenzimidazole phosphoribosyltransferase
MLQQLDWKQKLEKPVITIIENFTPVNHLELENFAVLHSDSSDLKDKLIDRINQKTKPLGSLGVLEKLALQIGLVFQSEAPKIEKPTIIVFAADHGIANHGVSAYPQEVTRQMVETFLKGGAAICVFCKQNNIDLKIVDAGVNYDFPTNTSIINTKIAKGTQSFLTTSAMSLEEMNLCFQNGADVVNEIYKSGSNCIGFGEMGIGNTSTASVLMSVLTKIPIQDCVGKGTGVMDEKLKNKIEILSKAISSFEEDATWENLVSHFGGFEILQMAGGMLQAYKNKMLILVDGFISTVAFLIAYQKNPAIKQNAIFSHCSEEKAHIDLLNYLQVEPILSLNMRLGEGSGCAVAFPIVKSAVTFLNEMATFESAGVSNK